MRQYDPRAAKKRRAVKTIPSSECRSFDRRALPPGALKGQFRPCALWSWPSAMQAENRLYDAMQFPAWACENLNLCLSVSGDDPDSRASQYSSKRGGSSQSKRLLRNRGPVRASIAIYECGCRSVSLRSFVRAVRAAESLPDHNADYYPCAILLCKLPSAFRTSTTSAMPPSACVAQLRQGSKERIRPSIRFSMPSVTSCPER